MKASPAVLKSWRLAALGAMGAPEIRPAFALTIALAACASGWAIASLSPSQALAVIGGVVGLTLWLQAPELGVYALVAILPFGLEYSVGGVQGVSLRDALLLAMGVSVLSTLMSRTRRVERLKSRFTRRILWIWAPLLVWSSITFVLGPANQSFLKDTFHNAWYIWGDTWRSMFVFPLVLMGLGQLRSVDKVQDILSAVGAGVSINAILLARGSDENAMGHFDHNNQLAGYLVMVLPLALARAAMHPDRRTRIFSAVAAVPMLRALWLAGSRGGLVAFLAALAILALFMPRRRLAAGGAVGLAVLALVVGMRGGDIPMLNRFLVLRDVKDVETFQWRQEQWQIFIERIRQRPVLGWGSDVDESLVDLDRARTAHNAFLALAVKSGIPATGAWIVILVLSVVQTLRRVMSPRSPDGRWFWAGMLAFLAAIVVHNLVESMLLTTVSQGLFWTEMACAAYLSYLLDRERGGTPLPASPAAA
jgi:O-antigen ligase